jgi:hypothetical protein
LIFQASGSRIKQIRVKAVPRQEIDYDKLAEVALAVAKQKLKRRR